MRKIGFVISVRSVRAGDANDAGDACIETYIDDAVFRLQGSPLPGCFANGDIKTVFVERSALDGVVASSPLLIAPGLDSVLSSTKSQLIDFSPFAHRPSEPVLQLEFLLQLY